MVGCSITLGICATDDVRTLPALLSAIGSFSGRYEVVVVTSGSSDGTVEAVDQFLGESRHRVIHIVENRRRGKWFALNLIFRVFTGEYLVLIPADVLTTEGAILRLVDKLSTTPSLGLISGHPIAHPHSPESLKLLWRLHGRALHVNGNRNSHATGELMAMRRCLASVLPSHTINDDAFLARRAVRSGWHVGVDLSALAIIRVPTSIRGYVRQRERIIMGHRQLRAMGGKSTTLRGLFSSSPLTATRLVLSELKSVGDVLNLLVLLMLEVLLTLHVRAKRSEEFVIWGRIE